tara:strand:+ start:759 stop:977 length:219 start_codon:yes stop_codon:yes gene_type:complete
MKKQSTFKLKSGNKPSPTKFFGVINRIMGRGKKTARRGMGAINTAMGAVGLRKTGQKGKRRGIIGGISRMLM